MKLRNTIYATNILINLKGLISNNLNLKYPLLSKKAKTPNAKNEKPQSVCLQTNVKTTIKTPRLLQ